MWTQFIAFLYKVLNILNVCFKDPEDADEDRAEHDQHHGPREQGDRREVPPQVRVLSVPALTLNRDSMAVVGSV